MCRLFSSTLLACVVYSRLFYVTNGSSTQSTTRVHTRLCSILLPGVIVVFSLEASSVFVSNEGYHDDGQRKKGPRAITPTTLPNTRHKGRYLPRD